MKYSSLRISHLLLIFIVMFSSLFGMSQNNVMMETVNATGSDALGSTGSATYSVGQVFFTYVGESVYNIAQGVQHSTLTEDAGEDIDNPEDIIAPDVDIFVYPNPTTDRVTLAMTGVDFENGQNTYQLFSYQGKLIRQHIIEGDNTEINLSTLSSSVYLLQVFVKNKIWKTFKILKQ